MIRKLGFALALVVFGVVAAIATISSSLNSITVAGTGAQTVFSFPFVGVAASDISVIYTNSIGVQTTLVQGTGPTEYQVTLNAAVAPSLWGVGGTITYDPSGTPIALGATLTIVRTLPYVQLTSLQNQASFGQLAQATEMALDQLEMQIQQVSNGFARVLQAPVNDPTGLNYTLPAAAQRANTGLAFDSQGNLIAGVLPSAGIISSPMQPVVDAASLAAGRSAFGLGPAATGQVNYGLQQGVSGTGFIDVNSTPVQDSTNQTVTAAFHDTRRICTGPITYTLPQANTTWAGFGFWVYAVSGVCTITPNAADNFLGLASGTSIAVPPGSWVYITTNAASSALWWADYHGAVNADLVAGVISSALTFTLYSGPIEFRDTTLANGDPVWSLPANGISVTIPSTATLGTGNNVPSRVYVFVAYNSGTPILGVATCSSPTAIYSCAAWETLQKTGTAISNGATAPGTLYTASATSDDSVVIVGYADFCITGSCTAGTWVAPTTIQLCLPPRQCRKPGDILQTIAPSFGTLTVVTTTGGPTATNVTANITPNATPNLIRYFVNTTGENSTGAGDYIGARIYRNSTAIGNFIKANASGAYAEPLPFAGYDAPGAACAPTCTYVLKSSTNGGTTSVPAVNTDSATEILEEIQGALEPPANDNGSSPLSKAA